MTKALRIIALGFLLALIISLCLTLAVYAQELPYNDTGVYILYRPAINAHDSRVNACRTYNIGGKDATDGMTCGNDTNISIHENKSLRIAPIAVQVYSSNVVQTNDIPAPKAKKDKEHKDNGNHYGNNRPDNNAHDVKNSHNGCNQNCTGNKDKKDKKDK